MAEIIVAGDPCLTRKTIIEMLVNRGYRVDALAAPTELLASLRAWRPDLAIVDVDRAKRADWVRSLATMQEQYPTVAVIATGADSDAESAVELMKLGVVDFISKPFAPGDLTARVDRILGAIRGRPAVGTVRLVGQSPAFRQALNHAARFAAPDIGILLHGATGTGKEPFARYIHTRSRRANGPFVPVDCSALTESLFESEFFGHDKGAFTGAAGAHKGLFDAADGGTLFLDEVCNLPRPLQAKLLRVLQERRVRPVGSHKDHEVDVRVIAATNADLQAAADVDTPSFRQDLYYRLAEVTIELPPLCQRTGDVGLLAEYFVAIYALAYQRPAISITQVALDLLQQYPWPGNVRELESVIKHAVVLADSSIGPEDLPDHLLRTRRADPVPTLARIEVLPEPEAHDDGATPLTGSVDLKAIGAEAALQAEGAVLRELVRRLSPSAAQLARLVNVDAKTLRSKLRRFDIVLRH
jgi:DNA-binding NtrC family response regulator